MVLGMAKNLVSMAKQGFVGSDPPGLESRPAFEGLMSSVLGNSPFRRTLISHVLRSELWYRGG